MSIRNYIRDQVFRRRAQAGCVVIYDPKRNYQEIALSMANDKCRVIDASTSIIEQREAAMEALQLLAEGKIYQLVIWTPVARPDEDDEKQKDPFSVFAAIGDIFPKGDGDDFLEICRRAKPDHVTEINRLFEDGEPSFEMIDALEEGGSWPKLKTLLGVNSPKEILLGLLSPRPALEAALKEDGSWVTEAREFSVRSLGHKLKTKGQTRHSIADELWRLLLFSEFVFDSADEVPKSLETVPIATQGARNLVFDVCEDLRLHDHHKDTYKTVAKEVESDMGLDQRIQEMTNLGTRDTFSCEERVFLNQVIEEACKGHIEEAKDIWNSRQKSIWLTEEDRMAEWSVAARAVELLESARNLSAPKFQSLEEVILGYTSRWRDLDRHHRELEQAANQVFEDHDGLEALLSAARKAYFKSVETLQTEFVRLVEIEGWPMTTDQILWNRQVFTKKVAPLLESGERVAYFLVDSLRYELGAELEKQLSNKLKVSLQPVCAQLPTYTEIGMASLMPDAEEELSLIRKDGKLVTTLGGSISTAPATRFAYLQSRKGDQCQDIDLDELLRKKKTRMPEQTKLLVVRTRDIDAIAHDSPHQVLDIIPQLVRQIIRGLNKVADLSFDTAVVATDHGFLLFNSQVAGNVAPKPNGNWLIQKSRCLLGDGDSDSSNLVMEAGQLGIPGDFKKYATPKTLVPYSKGQIYYHEGLSLQECVLPCLTVKLESEGAAKAKPIRLVLTYRQGKADKITSRRPVLDLAWPEGDLFADEVEREVSIEAVDSKGNIVGVVSTGQALNPATGFVRIKPGSAIAVALKMEDDFSGMFTVQVLDPTSNVQLADLKLKTAYME